MPIRFRCAYCEQLMAISHRKAGTVVRCPKCAGDIIVPAPDGMPTVEDPQQPGNQALDDPNFDAVLHDPGLPLPTVKTPPGNRAQQPIEVDPVADTPLATERRGLFIPLKALLTALAVVLILLLLIFVLGIVVGRSMVISTGAKKSAHRLPSPAEESKTLGKMGIIGFLAGTAESRISTLNESV